MGTATDGSFLLIGLFIGIVIYFAGVVYLSRKRKVYLGLILPLILAFVASYYFVKPMLIPNPHPTMQEGMYLTFFGALSLAGFIVFGIVKLLFPRRSAE